jgi:hypothetical protein
MRFFYAFWFFFCAGWGYLSATFPSEQSLHWAYAASTLTIALVMSIGLLWLELRKLPVGKTAPRPSLQLKPWNRPVGANVFFGLTFVFSGLWGLGLSFIFDLPSPAVAFQFFAMGAGLMGGCYFAYRLFPNKFSM